jgi:hypothetical protein
MPATGCVASSEGSQTNWRTARVQRRGAARQLGQPAVGGQHLGPRVPQDVGDLFGLEHEVDRHQHRAQARQREAQGREGVAVARQHGDAAALRTPMRARPAASRSVTRRIRRRSSLHVMSFFTGFV